MSSLKMTFSLTSLIFLIALGLVFAPTAVMAHVVDPADATHNPAADADTDTDNVLGTAHILVKSVTADKTIVKENDILTVTVEFAPSVVHEAMDDAPHATLINTAISALGDLSILRQAADGEFITITGTNPFTLQGSVITATAPVQAVLAVPGTPATAGVGGVYRVLLAVADTNDGVYQISVPEAGGITDESNAMGSVTVTVDTAIPVVSNIKFTAADYPQDDVFTEAFMVEFDATDTDGSGLGSVSDFKLTADPANVTFGAITKKGSNTFTATATPVASTDGDAAAVDIDITVTVVDKAGNSSDNAASGHSKTAMLKRPASEGEPEETPTPTDLEAMKTGLSVDAGKFILLVRSQANVKGLPETLPDGASIVEWADMPDLEALLYGGGSIDLTRAKAPKLDHDGDAATDARDAGARDLIITEVMWARNTALIGKAGELDHQWIEIHNPLKADVSAVTITTTKGRNFQTIADTDVLLDRLSNQVGAGWVFSGLGQNGSNDFDDMTDDVKSNFISMYRSNRGKEGWTKGHWSPSTETAIAGHKGTPGRLERTAAVVITATEPPGSPFVINEFGIGNSDGEDWVELRNVTTSEQTLKNLLLTSVTGLDAEAVEFHFHDKDLKVPAEGVVLIVSTHPEETDIAGGINLEIAKDDQEKRGLNHIYVVRSFELPTGKFNLILRKDYNNKPGDFLGKALGNVIDAMGSLKIDKDTADFNTDFWPLNGVGAPHGDVIDGLGQDFKAGTVYVRNKAAKNEGRGEHHLSKAPYTGIGYDRTAVKSDANGGTPGYANGKGQDKIAGLTTGEITISEIMVDTGERGQNLPQWIELYNSSMTQAVNLAGWKLHLENASGGPPIHAEDLPEELNTYNATLTFAEKFISPNQTLLIVSNAASGGKLSDRDHFPSTRIINLWTTPAHREALLRQKRTDQVISKRGFSLTLVDKDGVPVDQAGNLDGNRRTRDEPAWELPTGKDDSRRSSLIRVYGKEGQGALRMGYSDGEAIPGTMRDAWVSADVTGFANVTAHTYYGDSDDLGTPGIRGGGPLPVSLSKFRPERLKDTGEIVVRWVTESELNNAGFNILRSDKRDGEFTKVHFEAGEGTTSERTVYEWKDTSAKPNVVYYYQIQDVSLDGDVTTLRTTHLRGNVTAVGKATTTWGEIKALQ